MAGIIEISGDKEFTSILNQLPRNLANAAIRNIARKGGRVIVKEARKEVKIPGTLGKHFASELMVGNDRSNKKAVVVTVRGGRKSRKLINSAGKAYIPAAVGRHMTAGAKQKPRVTNKNKAYRGFVKNRYPDPIESAAASKGNEALTVMQTETVKIMQQTIKKLAKK